MLNVNDDVVTLIRWVKPEGSFVHKGEPIAVLETTKATFELESEHAGYLRAFVAEGITVGVGEFLGAICETADEQPQRPTAPAVAVAVSSGLPRKVTKKAEIAARKAGLDLGKLALEIPGEGAITESEIQAYLTHSGARKSAGSSADVRDVVDDVYPANRQQRLLLIGGGLGAVQLLDSLSRVENQRATVIVDDNPELHGKTLMGVPVLGGLADIEAMFAQKLFDAAVVSVGSNIGFRQRMFEKLTQLHIPMGNVIDPSARVQRNAVLGTGNVILAYCHIGSCAVIGNGNLLSSFVDIEHHCSLGDFCTFGPGVMMSALVKIGNGVKFGTGVFIEPKITIGSNSIIGSGVILVGNIPDNSIVKTAMNYTVRSRS